MSDGTVLTVLTVLVLSWGISGSLGLASAGAPLNVAHRVLAGLDNRGDALPQRDEDCIIGIFIIGIYIVK